MFFVRFLWCLPFAQVRLNEMEMAFFDLKPLIIFLSSPSSLLVFFSLIRFCVMMVPYMASSPGAKTENRLCSSENCSFYCCYYFFFTPNCNSALCSVIYTPLTALHCLKVLPDDGFFHSRSSHSMKYSILTLLLRRTLSFSVCSISFLFSTIWGADTHTQ